MNIAHRARQRKIKKEIEKKMALQEGEQ